MNVLSAMLGSGMQRPVFQHGFSLVEFLVASALGLVLLAVITAVFADISRTSRDLDSTGRQLDNARFALQVLQEDIAHAGYWAAHTPQFDDSTFTGVPEDSPGFLPDPCLPFSQWGEEETPGFVHALLGIPLQIHEHSPGAACESLLRHRVEDTPVLVVRHAAICAPGQGDCLPHKAGQLYFQASNCADELALGQRYRLLEVEQYTLTQRDCASTAGKYRFIQHLYFIRNYAAVVGDGRPTLVRSVFGLYGGNLVQQPAQALVEGIEQFHFELGVDEVSATGEAVNYHEPVVWRSSRAGARATNRGDGIPDGEFVACVEDHPCESGHFANVTAVRVHLLARATEPMPGYTNGKSYRLGQREIPAFEDPFPRKVFSTSVQLRTIAGRRAAW